MSFTKYLKLVNTLIKSAINSKIIHSFKFKSKNKFKPNGSNNDRIFILKYGIHKIFKKNLLESDDNKLKVNGVIINSHQCQENVFPNFGIVTKVESKD
jgi:hypothetical protein